VTDLLSVLRDRSTVGVTRCHGGVEETEVTRFFWVNPISDKSPVKRELANNYLITYRCIK